MGIVAFIDSFSVMFSMSNEKECKRSICNESPKLMVSGMLTLHYLNMYVYII